MRRSGGAEVARGFNEIYLASVSSSPLTPDEIRAAAETHHELGPEYQSAVIDSFLDKVGREIDARVDARIAARQVGQPGQFAAPGQYAHPGQYMPPAPPTRRSRERSAFALAVISMALGIPLSGIAVAAGTNPVGLAGLVVIWLAIAVINVAYSLTIRPPADRH